MAKSEAIDNPIFLAARGLLPVKESLTAIAQLQNADLRQDGHTALKIALDHFANCAKEQPANPLQIKASQSVIVELAKKGAYIYEPSSHIISDITNYLREQDLHIFLNQHSADLENMLIKEFLPKLPEPTPEDREYYLDLLNHQSDYYEKSALLKSFLEQLVSEGQLAQATKLANMKNQRGETALHIAAHGDDVDFTDFLLNEIGINDPNALDNSNNTAFDYTHSVRIKHQLARKFGVSSAELKAQKKQNPIYKEIRQNSIKSSDSGISSNNISRSQSLDSGLANEKTAYEIAKEILQLENKLSEIKKRTFSALTNRGQIQQLKSEIANLYQKLDALDTEKLNQPFNDNGQYRTILDLARLPANHKSGLKAFTTKKPDLLTGQDVRASNLKNNFSAQQKFEKTHAQLNQDLANTTLPNLADTENHINNIKSSLENLCDQANSLGIALDNFEIYSTLQNAFQRIEDIKENQFYHKLAATSAFTNLLRTNSDYAATMAAAQKILKPESSMIEDYPILTPEEIEEISLIARKFAQNFCDIEYDKFARNFELARNKPQTAFDQPSQPITNCKDQLEQAEEILNDLIRNPQEKSQQFKEIFNNAKAEHKSQFADLQDRNGNKIVNYAYNFDRDFFVELV